MKNTETLLPQGKSILQVFSSLNKGVFVHFVLLVWSGLTNLQDKLEGIHSDLCPSLQFKKIFSFKNIEDVKTPELFPPLRYIVNSMEDMAIKLDQTYRGKNERSTKLRQFQYAIKNFQTAVYEHQIHLLFGCVKDDNQKPMINLLRGKNPSQYITRNDFLDRAHPLIFGKAIKIFCVVLDLGINLTSSTNLNESKLIDEILNDRYCSRFPSCPSTDSCMQLAQRSIEYLSQADPAFYNIMISVINDLENGIKKISSPGLETSSLCRVKIQARKAQVLSNTELLNGIKMTTPVLSRNDSTTDSSLSTSSSSKNISVSTAAASSAFSDRYEQISNNELPGTKESRNDSRMHDSSRNKENIPNKEYVLHKRNSSSLDDDDHGGDDDDDNLDDVFFNTEKPRLIIVVDNPPATYLSQLFLFFIHLFILRKHPIAKKRLVQKATVLGSRHIGVNGFNGNEANQMVFNRVSISVNKKAATSTTLEPALSAYELVREANIKRRDDFIANLNLPPSKAEQLATKKEAARQARLLNKQNKPVTSKDAITPREGLRGKTMTSEENKSSSQKVLNENDRHERTNNDGDDNDDGGDDDDDDDDDHHGPRSQTMTSEENKSKSDNDI